MRRPLMMVGLKGWFEITVFGLNQGTYPKRKSRPGNAEAAFLGPVM